jgi:thioesterase domain-containing protein
MPTFRLKQMPLSEPENTSQIGARMETLINLAFKREVIRKVKDVILPLNDAGSGPSLYCVHSIVGVGAEYRDLARMLGPRQNFYSIQAPTDKRNAEFARSIKSMSQYYVEELLQFQPEGPFVLGGYSVGATIALEMSQQLIARGREVSLLFVIDGELLNTGARNPGYWLKLLLYLPQWIANVLVVKYSFQSFFRAIASEAIARIRRVILKSDGKNVDLDHPVERLLSLASFSPDHVAFIKQLYDTHLEYVPERYSSPALVFLAKPQPIMQLGEVEAAWKKIAPSSEFFEVNGNHLNMKQMPYGLPIAEQLSKKIDEIGGRTRPNP